MAKVVLYNVMDIRTGKIYSEVKVSEYKARYFVPVDPEVEEEK